MQLIHNGNVIMTNEGGSIAKPITAWAVEIEGKIDPLDIYPTRASARYVRNAEVKLGHASKASVRKVVLQVVPGR